MGHDVLTRGDAPRVARRLPLAILFRAFGAISESKRGGRVRLRVVAVLLLLLSSTGCVVVGGYSSGRGFWIWPGSIVFILIALALFLVFRRRG